MGKIGGFAKVTQRAIWVLMLTIVPIVLISVVWDKIVDYLPLFFSVVFLMGSGMFMFYYIKFYDFKVLMFKIKRFFYEKESIEEYMFNRFRGEERRRSKHFLVISIGMMVIGGYLLHLHFNPGPIEGDIIELIR